MFLPFKNNTVELFLERTLVTPGTRERREPGQRCISGRSRGGETARGGAGNLPETATGEAHAALEDAGKAFLQPPPPSRVESAVRAEGTGVFRVINNFYDPHSRGGLPGTHTQSGSFIHQTHTSVSALTPSSGFYLKIQHLEQSHTVASEIKLLRKLYVTVNLRFMALGSCSAAGGAWGFLAPARY